MYVKLSYGKLRWWDEPPAASTLSFHNEYEEAAWCDTITTNQNILYVRLGYVWGQLVYFFKEINSFIQQGHIKLIKMDSEDIYNVKNFLFWISIHQIILKKVGLSQFPQKY